MTTREHITNFPKVLTREGYFDRFLELSAETRNYKEAYYQTEEELSNFGLKRYSSYESFRVGKCLFFSAKEEV